MILVDRDIPTIDFLETMRSSVIMTATSIDIFFFVQSNTFEELHKLINDLTSD